VSSKLLNTCGISKWLTGVRFVQAVAIVGLKLLACWGMWLKASEGQIGLINARSSVHKLWCKPRQGCECCEEYRGCRDGALLNIKRGVERTEDHCGGGLL